MQAVAYFDTCEKRKGKGKGQDRTRRLYAAALYANVKSWKTVDNWTAPRMRTKIVKLLALPISAFSPGNIAKNKGGRGHKAPGRGVFHFSLLGRRPAKFPEAEERLIGYIREQRKQGHAVRTRQVRAKMLEFVAAVNVGHRPLRKDEKEFKASAGWMKRFMARYGLCWRRRNDKATKSVTELVKPVATFINLLRRVRMRSVRANTCKRYGQYDLLHTFNVDQVPMPFANGDPRTLEFVGAERVWVKSAGAGLEKRQCTLQLLIRPVGRQPIPCIIFRGKHTHTRKGDKKKRAAEMIALQAASRGKVLVLWQDKAWADTATCVEWADKGYGAFVKEEQLGKTLLLADNLSAQCKAEFKAAVKEHADSHTLMGPPGATHVWQPADHHVGAAYKLRMGRLYDEFMVNNFAQYEKGIPAAERRMLLVQWTAAVYEELEEARIKAEAEQASDPTADGSLFYRAFVRTGCMVSASGWGDELIMPHREIKDELYDTFVSYLRKPDQMTAEVHKAEAEEKEMEAKWIIPIGSDTEDEDDDADEPYGDSDVDGESDNEHERIPEDMELEVPNEAELIADAAAAVDMDDVDQVRDWGLALRMAKGSMQQDGEYFQAAPPTRSGRKRSAKGQGAPQTLPKKAKAAKAKPPPKSGKQLMPKS
jgi:hypothetical protein